MNRLRLMLDDTKAAVYTNPVAYAWAQRHGASVKALPGTIRSRVLFTEREVQAVGRPLWTRGPATWLRPLGAAIGPTLTQRSVAWPHRLTAWPPVVLEDAYLVGRHGAVVTRDGDITLSAFADQPRVLGLDGLEDLEQFDHRCDPPPARLGVATSLTGRLAPNYFHWMVDNVARLEHLARIEATTEERVVVVIPDNAPAIARESLELLDIDPSRIVVRNTDDDPWRIERYVHIPFPGRHIARSPTSLRWLQQAYLTASGCQGGVADRRLLILRPVGGWRHLANRDEVVEALTPLGFEMVDPGRLTLAEQIRLFRRASCIVGEHGAALTNIVFAPNAAVVEINAGYGGSLFAHLARQLGNRHTTVKATARGGDDAHVDVADVGTALRAIGVR